jgi:hypothetical protein
MRFLNPTEAEFAKLVRASRPVVRLRPLWKRRLWRFLLVQIESRRRPGRTWRLRASLMES